MDRIHNPIPSKLIKKLSPFNDYNVSRFRIKNKKPNTLNCRGSQSLFFMDWLLRIINKDSFQRIEHDGKNSEGLLVAKSIIEL